MGHNQMSTVLFQALDCGLWQIVPIGAPAAVAVLIVEKSIIHLQQM